MNVIIDERKALLSIGQILDTIEGTDEAIPVLIKSARIPQKELNDPKKYEEINQEVVDFVNKYPQFKGIIKKIQPDIPANIAPFDTILPV